MNPSMMQLSIPKFCSRLLVLLVTMGALLVANTAAADSFTVSANRTKVELNESFQLTLSIDEQIFVGTPDLSGIEENFRIIGQKQDRQYNNTNGKTMSSTNWILSLKPKRSGYLVIPPIEFKGMTSQAIAIEVTKVLQTKASTNSPVFFETDVDRSKVYIQSQLLYQVKLYTSVGISRANISEPKLGQAFIRSLGTQLMYETVRDGVRYQVHEWNYTIFPQQAGTLVIPAPVLTATVSSRSTMYGRPISITTEDLSIEVKPIPASYPNIPWIATPSLKLFEQWEPEQSTINIGDSITRTIEFHLNNNEAALLGVIDHSDIPGLKIYPDKPQTEDHQSDKGIQGTRVDKVAYVATKAGTVTVPELEVSWWNTETEQLQSTVLPARTFQVIDPTPQTQPVEMPKTPVVVDSAPEENQNVATGAMTSANRWWIITNAVFAALVILLGFLLWRTRNQLTAIQQQLDNGSIDPASKSNHHSFDEKQAFERLQQAATGQSPGELWKDLIRWGQHYWLTDSIRSSDDLVRRLPAESELVRLIQNLDQALFRQSTASFTEAEQLIAEVGKQRRIKQQHVTPTGNDELRPLYPL